MSIMAPNFFKLYGMLGTPGSIAMQEYCKLKHRCRRKQCFDKSDNETELPSGCNLYLCQLLYMFHLMLM